MFMQVGIRWVYREANLSDLFSHSAYAYLTGLGGCHCKMRALTSAREELALGAQLEV